MKLKFTDIPRSTDLFCDYLYDFKRVGEFYPRMPYDESSYGELFERLRRGEYDREGLCNILTRQNRSFNNSPVTIQSIERLRKPDTFVIFTGQQVGLFGGPLYTIYKAMTAINLARYLTLTTAHTFLPLFWVEGEDHDFEEIRSTHFINKDNNVHKLTYDPAVPFAGQCVGDMIIDSTMAGLVEQFEQATHPSDFKDEVLGELRRCYGEGTKLSDAFARWMAYLLGRYGLILVDPSDPAIKKMARPVFVTSLRKHRDLINPALTDADRRLEEKGYHQQVGHRMDTLDFFYHEPRRLPFVRQDEGRYLLKGTRRHFDAQEIEELLRDQVENFSPNVVLRPLMQDYVFPTAAYVAGPSEIAYFAQFAGIYEVFGIPMPVIYPRKSLTIIEGKVDKILSKYDLEFTHMFTPKEDLIRQVLASQIPGSLRRAIDGGRQAIEEKLSVLEKEAVAFNPNLAGVVGSMRGRLLGEYDRGESRIAQAVEKKDKITRHQVEKAVANLYPDSRLQERRLNLLTYLCRYSHRLIYGLMEMTCCRHESDHMIWKVNI